MKKFIQSPTLVLVVVCVTILERSAVAEEGLVNHWKFDGNYKDSVGKNHAWAVHTDVKGPPSLGVRPDRTSSDLGRPRTHTVSQDQWTWPQNKRRMPKHGYIYGVVVVAP